MSSRAGLLILSTTLSADEVVLVMQADSTRREAARKVIESFQSARGGLWAAVLNKRALPVAEFVYFEI